MNIAGLFLADAATVREALLHVLGGGITLLARPEFPAGMGVHLVVLVRFEWGDEQKEWPLKAEVVHMSMPDETAQIAGVQGHVGYIPEEVGGPKEGADTFAPLVLDLTPAVLPEPGRYRIAVTVGDLPTQTLYFVAHQGQLEPAAP